MAPVAAFTPYFKYMGPAPLRRLLVRMTPWPLLQRLRRIVDTMADAMAEVYTKKMQERHSQGHEHEKQDDIMSTLRE
jgi:hypothetical protein